MEADPYQAPEGQLPLARPGLTWGERLLGLVAAGLILTPIVGCLGLFYLLESRQPAADAHPRGSALFSTQVSETKSELIWAARTALAHARGQPVPGAEISGGEVKLGQGRGCFYEVHRGPLRTLAKLSPDEGLRDFRLLDSKGKPFQPNPALVMTELWSLHARCGELDLVFEFEWHDMPLSSCLNLQKVRVKSPAGASPTPSAQPSPRAGRAR